MVYSSNSGQCSHLDLLTIMAIDFKYNLGHTPATGAIIEWCMSVEISLNINSTYINISLKPALFQV